MNYYDPRGGKGRISHGGTFNANPVTMAGGVATMQELTPEAYAKLDALGDRLRAGVKRVLVEAQAGRAGDGARLALLDPLDEEAPDRLPLEPSPPTPSGRSAPSWRSSTTACS